MTVQEELNLSKEELKKANKSVFRGRIALAVLGIVAIMNGIYGFTQQVSASKQYERAEDAARKTLMYAQDAEKTRNQAITAAEEMAKTLGECAKLANKNP
jgi:hypothetical protein